MLAASRAGRRPVERTRGRRMGRGTNPAVVVMVTSKLNLPFPISKYKSGHSMTEASPKVRGFSLECSLPWSASRLPPATSPPFCMPVIGIAFAILAGVSLEKTLRWTT
jgi:hypothetical protein